MAGDPAGVAVVDHGLSFGGSVVVAATLLKAVDRAAFAPILIAAAPPDVVGRHTDANVRSEQHVPGYTYQDGWRVRHRLERLLPGPLARVVAYPTLALAETGNVAYVYRLMRIFRRERIRLVHLNNGLANLPAGLAAVLLGLPMVVHSHGVEASSKRTRWLAARAAGFVAISDFVAQSLVTLGIPVARIRTIHNPVEVGEPEPALRTDARRRFGIGEHAPAFGIVGRIIRWKGQREFLDAAFRVLASHPTAVAVIVGDSADGGEAYLAEIRELVRASTMESRVIFTGFVPDTRPIYAMLDVLVHSSIEPEPFGLVITEAMAAGVPVVAADRGAPREIIADGTDGFLRNPTDSAAVAAAIASLLDDPALRRRLGDNGRAMVRARYDPNRYARSVEAVWRSALSGGPRATG
ncbi:MAG TPA: glycosyltransferase family 4 protein [Gemmatimonadales bacterium]|nr:glycosyltransferase family 4 protein [Gemmatimonadales bacterium]